jgi:hypothetical protein
MEQAAMRKSKFLVPSLFIKPAEDAAGPMSPLRDLLERASLDEVVRAIDHGLEVFDAGDVLFARQSSFDMIRELTTPSAVA